MKDRISSKTGYTLIFTSAALLLALALGVLALTCSAMGSSDAADSVPDGAVTPAPAYSTPEALNFEALHARASCRLAQAQTRRLHWLSACTPACLLFLCSLKASCICINTYA